MAIGLSFIGAIVIIVLITLGAIQAANFMFNKNKGKKK
jgi:hypothetical protein